jgi:hypothetical protein
MKQIVESGLTTFTPGSSGSGTVVFSGFIGFNPARLMAITNITRDTIIYIAEKPTKGGVWSGLSASGGTLSLAISTSGHAGDDVLRCIYDSAESTAPPPARGGNLWPIDFDACALDTGNSRVADYGPGPRPGTRATQLTLNGDNEGAHTGTLTLVGRTDGAMFALRMWIKGIGNNVEINIKATGLTSTVREVVVSKTIAAPTTWTEYIIRGYVAQFDCATLTACIKASGSGSRVVQVCEPDLRLLESQDFPEYQPPNGIAQDIFITKRLTTTVAAWSDSMWRTCSVPLAAILKGTKVYNGGVGGEKSYEILARFLGTSDDVKKYRAYGVTVIWSGHNNWSDVPQIIADIDAMIAALKHSRYLVLALTGGPPAGPGTAPYNGYSRAYREFKARYGTHFVDLNRPLHGGTGYSLDAYRVDDIHLNDAGCDLVAHEVAKAIVRNGWMEDWQPVPEVEAEDSYPQPHYVQYAGTWDKLYLVPYGRKHGFIIVNTAANGVLYLRFGWNAENINYDVKLNPGERYELIGSKYHGPVEGRFKVDIDGNVNVTIIY